MTKQKTGWFGLKKWFAPAEKEEEPDLLLESLQKYIADNSQRDQFYKTLCESDVFVINMADGAPIRDAKTGMLTHSYSFKTPQLEFNSKQWVGIFSSLPLLAAHAKGEVKWLSLNTLEFFSLMPDANVLLNPDSQHGAQLPKEVIQEIRKKYNQKYSS